MQENLGKLDPCVGGRRWNQTAGCKDQNEQGCKANSCFLLAPLLLIFLPRAEDGAPSVMRRSRVPGRSTAGWSRVQGQLTTTARSLQSLQHFPASPEALLGMAQHLLQQICCGRAAGEMEPSVCGENRHTIVWEKLSTPLFPPVSSLGENSLFPSA